MSKRLAEEISEDVDDDWEKNKFSKLENSDLDDDDEDDEEDDGKYEILAKDDIEGQEESGITHDGDVEITPFNMDEELEEGHFDSTGMYIWNKENNMKDGWLEHIDWVKIKRKDEQKNEGQESDSDSELLFDELPLYEEMLKLMNPNETVSAALRRHGGSKSLSASERLKLKKAGVQINNEESNGKTVTKLTEFADTILSRTGNMDIYQMTYEQIENMISKGQKKKKTTDVNNTDNDLDMYSDDFDKHEKARLKTEPNSSSSNTQALKETTGKSADNEPQWEYKKKLEDNDTCGPHSTSQMIKWTQEEYFKERVWVRKYGSDGRFYSSDRVDFELYI